jgi:hypothetical protein
VRDGLLAIPASGGPVRKLTTPDIAHGESRHLLPQFLPGGRGFIYTAGSEKPGNEVLYAGSLDSSDRTPIMPIASGATFVPCAGPSCTGSKGYLLFDRGGYLMAQPFDAATVRAQGTAFTVAGPVACTGAAAASGVHVLEASITSAALVYRPLPVSGSQPRISLIALTDQKPADRDVVVLRNWMATLR